MQHTYSQSSLGPKETLPSVAGFYRCPEWLHPFWSCGERKLASAPWANYTPSSHDLTAPLQYLSSSISSCVSAYITFLCLLTSSSDASFVLSYPSFFFFFLSPPSHHAASILPQIFLKKGLVEFLAEPCGDGCG